MYVCLKCGTKRRVYKRKIGNPQHNLPCIREGCYGITSDISRNTLGLAAVIYNCGFEIEKTEAVAVELATLEPFAAIFLTISLRGHYPLEIWKDLPKEIMVCYSQPDVKDQSTILYNIEHDATLFQRAPKGINAEIRRVVMSFKNCFINKQKNYEFEVYSLAGWVR